jgi:murein DD-endopeptidase MepM/ murein hydrolase activator NlpD
MNKSFRYLQYYCVALVISACFFACSKQVPGGLFGKKSPHQLYQQRLNDAGLTQTTLGRLWLETSNASLLNPVDIRIPYKEAGYFAAERIKAVAFRFSAKQGEKITIIVSPVKFKLYTDLFEINSQKKPQALASADTLKSEISYEIEKEGVFLIRLQPELLVSGEYTLTITSRPSLAYPIKATGKNHIQSFWGDGRDNGTRKHEGIDLFAPFRTPVIAAADGVVRNVQETAIGGKVVWLKPTKGNYHLYYAHLDSQLVTNGQLVKTGDTLGLMGKTGNAKHTSPHLHFGIYTGAGAVNPYQFVNPDIKKTERIIAPVSKLNATLITANKAELLTSKGETVRLDKNLPVVVEAASSNLYRVLLPDKSEGYISYSKLVESIPVQRTILLKDNQYLFENPDTLSARKGFLSSGKSITLIANFKSYRLVSNDSITGWIIK